MRFVILTGLSGAGKSTALRRMEDLGYFCVDNLPPLLIPGFAKFLISNASQVEKAAVVVDGRSGDMLDSMSTAIRELEDEGIRYEVFFLDSGDEYLIQRFQETRRPHPFCRDGSVEEGIQKERIALGMLQDIANNVIDTSTYNLKQLYEAIDRIFGESDDDDSILILVSTFGFKRGIPVDADMIFDVRFLPNPFYVEELKPYSGKNDIIKKYVMEFPQTAEYLEKLADMVRFLVPLYGQQHKSTVRIAIGCTGGMHRSVAVAELLYQKLKVEGFRMTIVHRDIGIEE